MKNSINWILNLIFIFNYINYNFVIRLKRVQVQLNATSEETYRIINDIRWSVNTQIFASVIICLLYVMYIVDVVHQKKIPEDHSKSLVTRSIIYIENIFQILFHFIMVFYLSRMIERYVTFFRDQEHQVQGCKVKLIIIIWQLLMILDKITYLVMEIPSVDVHDAFCQNKTFYFIR